MLSLTTSQLELRPMPAAAAKALAHDREAVPRMVGATLPEDWPQRELLAVLPHQALAAPEEERFGVWMMIERATNTVVGDIGFLGPPDASGGIEIGYSVIPDRRRRGYAGEAVQAMVEWAFGQPGVRVVVADCDADNRASIRTLERAGFRVTGQTDGRISWTATRQRDEVGCQHA